MSATARGTPAPAEHPPGRHGRALGLYLLTVVPLLVLLASLAVWLFSLHAEAYQVRLRANEARKTAIGAAGLGADVRGHLADILVLGGSAAVRAFAGDPNPGSAWAVEQLFMELGRLKGDYDQLRLLDRQGRERLRVNFGPQGASVVPPERLQDKVKRYYTREAANLAPGEIYVSPLDLNVEGGRVEQPHTPTIRAATPVFGPDGRRWGMLIANVAMGGALEALRAQFADGSSELLLAAADGTVLLAPDPVRDWSFMFGEAVSLESLYPGVGGELLRDESAQRETPFGLLTAHRAGVVSPGRRPRWAGQLGIAGTNAWWVVSRISPYHYSLGQVREHLGAFLLVGLLLALVAAGGWRLVLTGQRLTARRRETHNAVRAALDASEARGTVIVENALDGIVSLDGDGRIVACNRAAERIFGVPSGRLTGLPYQALVTGLPDTATQGREPPDDHPLELLGRRPDGSHFPLELSWRPVHAEGDVHAILFARDISERKRMEKRLAQLASYDTITGALNRNGLGQRLETLAKAARADSGLQFALLLLDVDDFSGVNDALGHVAGDRLLAEIAGRLQVCLGNQGVLARFGGDEFVLVLERPGDRRTVADFCERLIRALASPFQIQGGAVQVSASIGVALAPWDGADETGLLQAADAAMYAAKAGCRGRYRFFTPDLRTRLRREFDIRAQLAHAQRRGEFGLHYQPLVRADRSVVGVEALLRWNNPTLGEVPPDEFIPVAEHTGHVLAIGEWVLERSCRQLALWRRELGLELRLAINLSPRQLTDSGIVAAVRRALEAHGLPPGCLELEITEGYLVDDPAQAEQRLGALRAMGVRLAMDDFGTGYSSLSYLRRFPFTSLKIDRSFVEHIASSALDARLVRRIQALAADLGVEVVAEGIEQEDQYRVAVDCGCDLFQGRLIQSPVPAEVLERWLQASAGRWAAGRVR